MFYNFLNFYTVFLEFSNLGCRYGFGTNFFFSSLFWLFPSSFVGSWMLDSRTNLHLPKDPTCVWLQSYPMRHYSRRKWCHPPFQRTSHNHVRSSNQSPRHHLLPHRLHLGPRQSTIPRREVRQYLIQSKCRRGRFGLFQPSRSNLANHDLPKISHFLLQKSC